MIRSVSRGAAVAVFLVLGACSTAPAPTGPVPEPERPAEPQRPEGPLGEPVDLPVAEPAEEPREPPAPPPDTASPPEVPELPAPAPAPIYSRAEVPVLPGSVLPRERIVAFYGNPASTRMGILGELPTDEMLSRLDHEVASWRAADPATPVRPALHMIAVMATGDPGQDSLYRLRMPERRIEQVMEWADRRDALVFLDIQPGWSSVPAELPRLERWLIRPNVHLALDPEWDMAEGVVPGRQIGSMAAAEVTYAVRYLADLVEAHDLPPKVLVVHRFTQAMVPDADQIELDPRVQLVINMDGWGPPAMKIQAYRDIVAPEAPQFTGFKLFFRNDRRDGSRLLTPGEILALTPVPIYIQYQ